MTHFVRYAHNLINLSAKQTLVDLTWLTSAEK